MKNNTIRFIRGLLILAGVSSPAFAFNGHHATYSQLRPYTGGEAYISQSVHAVKDTTKFNLGTKESVSKGLEGYSLRTAFGVEHLKSIQTGVFYSNVQESGNKIMLSEYRAHEFGAEVKLTFASPVVNISLGGGGFYSNGTYRSGAETVNMRGNGFFGGVDLVYYVSSKMNFLLTGMQVMSTSKASSKASVTGLSGSGLRVGGGVNIWL
jgi:hypothetical protein